MSAPATFLVLHKAQRRVERALRGLSLADQRDVVLRVIAEAEAGQEAPAGPAAVGPKPVPQCITEIDGPPPGRCQLYLGHTGDHDFEPIA